MIQLPFSNTQRIWLFRGALVVTVAVVSWLAFTASSVEISGWASDKVNHFAAFFVLAFLLDRSFPKWGFARYKVWPLLAYGLLIELVQNQLSYREFSYLDFLADSVALLVYWGLRHPFRKLIPAQ